MNFNIELFKFINGLAYKNTLLDSTMIFLSSYVPYIFMSIFALLFIYGVIKRKENIRFVIVDTFIITVLTLISSYFIGIVYYIPRPFVSGKVNLLMPHVIDASFPSDHAVGTMSIAIGINKYNKVYGLIMIILSCFVGVSRVYVGHHYPVDVIGGYLIVTGVNFLYTKIAKNKARNLYLKAEVYFIQWKPVSNVIKSLK